MAWLSAFEAALDIRAQMHAQRAPAALGQHVEIAARLRRLDHAEGVFLLRAPADPRRRRR